MVLLALTGSRSALSAALLMIVLAPFFSWRDGQNGRGLSMWARAVFLAVIAVALAFTIVYPSLYGTALGDTLQTLSRDYMNKNFFSGREVIWGMLLDAVEGHELFGLGLTVTPSQIYETNLSSHSLYLQTILQSGIVGLLLLLLVLWQVARRLGALGGWAACVGVAFICGILVHECFEVSLTQNNIHVGLLFWMVMGVCISVARQERAAVTSASEESRSE